MLKKILFVAITLLMLSTNVVLAEIANKAMLDREVVSLDKRKIAGTQIYQAAKLPEGVIPAIEAVQVPRNQKVRIMNNVPRVIKVQPVVDKTQHKIVQPVVKTLPKIHEQPTPIYPKTASKIIKTE